MMYKYIFSINIFDFILKISLDKILPKAYFINRVSF